MEKARPLEVDGRVYRVPPDWSDNAATVFVGKYCRRHGDKFVENGVEPVFRRLIDFWFPGNRAKQALLFNDLWCQVASPNSPQYFNAGIYKQYGVAGNDIGLWRYDHDRAKPSYSTYEHPQLHACFIQTVDDSLPGIMDLLLAEAILFSRGSGTGSNFSPLRGKGERIGGGGTSSGLISFLKVFDVSAGAVKSGGTTRRAAKMVVLDIDHPDLLDFIDWKSREEHKAQVLSEAGYGDSWESESYQTVAGQNSNNSISVTNKFMDALASDSNWQLRGRVDRQVDKTMPARVIWQKLCQAAWNCADPGVQFPDIINSWNTTPQDGRIVASNPCSEHLRLNDSACNLASINLGAFLTGNDDVFNVDKYLKVIRRWTDVLDKSVDLAAFPTKQIAVNAHRYRDIGLGYCNLGSLLMQLGVAYDSEAAQLLAGFLTAILTATAYVRSAELSEDLGCYPAYKDNKQDHLRVVDQHYQAMTELHGATSGLRRQKAILGERYEDLQGVFNHLRSVALNLWHKAVRYSTSYGVRNAQLTVIAPTGTIGLAMDAETTGVEPLFALTSVKTLAGGGTLTQASKSVGLGLSALGYGPDVVADVTKHIQTDNTILGRRGVKKAHREVFQTAVGDNTLPTEAHIHMLAAVQPFVSGGISKTVNMPNSATVEDVDNTYQLAYKLGVKCVAVYRDGCKAQPLKQAECKTCGDDMSCTIDNPR